MARPDVPTRCSVCGETDPWPRSICLAKLTGDASPGRPCQYSAEGCERTSAAIQAKAAEVWANIEQAKAHGAALIAAEDQSPAIPAQAAGGGDA